MLALGIRVKTNISEPREAGTPELQLTPRVGIPSTSTLPVTANTVPETYTINLCWKVQSSFHPGLFQLLHDFYFSESSQLFQPLYSVNGMVNCPIL